MPRRTGTGNIEKAVQKRWSLVDDHKVGIVTN